MGVVSKGRIRRAIAVNGRQCWTLFDTGALFEGVDPLQPGEAGEVRIR